MTEWKGERERKKKREGGRGGGVETGRENESLFHKVLFDGIRKLLPLKAKEIKTQSLCTRLRWRDTNLITMWTTLVEKSKHNHYLPDNIIVLTQS